MDGHAFDLTSLVLDDLSFHATRHTGESITIDAQYVDAKLKDIAGDENRSRYIL